MLRQGMEYYIPFSDAASFGGTRPWFDADCGRTETRTHAAYLVWADARRRRAGDTLQKKRAFNWAAKSCKKALQTVQFKHIGRIGNKLAFYPPSSKAFWSLSKAVESNFCRPSLPPLLGSDGTLAHTAVEKANLFAYLFAESSRLDTVQQRMPLSIAPVQENRAPHSRLTRPRHAAPCELASPRAHVLASRALHPLPAPRAALQSASLVARGSRSALISGRA
uniref:SFRICE_033928 n=1 Tax=Spodoptera frugiperda TaxID=7108 RepID=A0A2H1W521_SPOFR